MKVLHLSTTDRQGGASIAAFRVSEAMKGAGIDSKMLVVEKLSDTDMVVAIKDYKFKYFFYYNRMKQSLANKIKNFLFKPILLYSTDMMHVPDISRMKEINEADVIYIYWVHNSFMNIKDISQILKLGKPVFFSLQDMWHMTGGCHYAMGCEEYKHDCKKCPMIQRRLMKGRSHALLNKKLRLWNTNNIHVIAPSRWMQDCAQKSQLFHQRQVFCIPNTLNDRVFRVMDKRVARDVLGLPQDRHLVMFGAIGGTTNRYKGWEYADSLMQRMGKEADLVVLGNTYKSSSYKTYAIGRLNDEYSLAYLYNAVDVFISPTQAECFGQTISESISCGTKAVVFNVGGVSDIVTHQDNGYLAEPNNVDDLERGVRWVFETNNDESERRRLHEDIRSKFSYSVVAAQHCRIIEDVFDGKYNHAK